MMSAEVGAQSVTYGGADSKQTWRMLKKLFSTGCYRINLKTELGQENSWL